MSLLNVFKPKWQNPDLAMRKIAVQNLSSTDLDALLEVAKDDSEADIRRIAVQKIPLAFHLQNLLASEKDASVQNAIKESLRKEWVKTVKNHYGSPSQEIRQILGELQAKDIEELIKTAKSTEVRIEIVESCSKQGLLAQAAKSDSQETVAMAALAKVQRENLLEEISNNATSDAVRRKAREMLLQLQSSKIDPEKERAEQLTQKQKALLAHASRLSENKNPLSVEAEMQRLEAEALSLSKEAATLGLPCNKSELNSVFAKYKEYAAAEKNKAEEEKSKKQTEEDAHKKAEEERLKEVERKKQEAKNTEAMNMDAEYEKVDENAEIDESSKISDEEYNTKLPLLQAIIERVKALDENGDFNEISQKIRQAFYDWKEVVGEKKAQFKGVYKEFRAATGRFQNLQEWASWHAEQIREQLIKEIEDLANSPVVLENRAKAFALLEQWKAAGYMPPAKIQEFWPRFKIGMDKIMDSVMPLLKEQEHGQEENLKIKEEICAQIEELAITEGEWAEQLKKIQELQAKWKNTGFVPKAQNHVIWERYQSAVNAFFKKQEVYKKRINEQINERISAREKLCEEAEALANSTDWKNTPKEFAKLRSNWKTAGSVPADEYEKLLQRFKGASDAFFERRNLFFEGSKKQREELCAKMEALNFDAANSESVKDWKALEAEWKAIENEGHSKELSDRFFAVSDQIWEAVSKNNPDTAKELDKNWEIKHGLTEQLRTILEAENFKFKTLQIVRSLQTEWEKTGRCGLAEAEISAKFIELIQKFFSLYNDQKEIRSNLDKINAQKKEDLCRQAEDLLAKAESKGVNRTEAFAEANALRASWRESGNVSMHLAKVLWERFNNACNAACHAFDDEPQAAD
jgi:hypothetical protein